MTSSKTLSYVLSITLLALVVAALPGCPGDDDDDNDDDTGGDTDTDADGDADTEGDCTWEGYCDNYIECGWYADQDACLETSQQWIDDCVGSLADWIDCSCDCFDEFGCDQAQDLDGCLSGCYATHCM